MSRLSRIITGKQRQDDREQAGRIDRALGEVERAYREYPLDGGREGGAAIARAQAALERADSNASPRAARTGISWYVDRRQQETPDRGRTGRNPR